jgi:hypothetical protein
VVPAEVLPGVDGGIAAQRRMHADEPGQGVEHKTQARPGATDKGQQEL